MGSQGRGRWLTSLRGHVEGDRGGQKLDGHGWTKVENPSIIRPPHRFSLYISEGSRVDEKLDETGCGLDGRAPPLGGVQPSTPSIRLATYRKEGIETSFGNGEAQAS